MSQQHVVCNKEADIAVIKADVGTMKDDIKAIKASILGNGAPGLTTRAAKLEQSVGAITWVGGTLFISVSSAVIALIFEVFA